MNPEALEHFGADQSRHKHESPEIKGVPWMLEEPESIHKAITISLNNVIQRIQLQNMVKPSRNVRNRCLIPQNRGCPHSNVQNYVNNLAEITEKRHDCTGQIGKHDNQADHCKGIITDLDNLNRREFPINAKIKIANAIKNKCTNNAEITFTIGSTLILNTTFFTR